ncbi:MAG: hypothetical protein ACP5M4_10475 [Acidobacteriaceae bacterium]
MGHPSFAVGVLRFVGADLSIGSVLVKPLRQDAPAVVTSTAKALEANWIAQVSHRSMFILSPAVETRCCPASGATWILPAGLSFAAHIFPGAVFPNGSGREILVSGNRFVFL